MIIDGSRATDRSSALVLRFYAAYNRRDLDAMLECVADDVVHEANQGSREIGRGAFRASLQRKFDAFREELRDIVVMCIDDGTRAAAEFAVRGTYEQDAPGLPPARGQRYALSGGGFFAIHRGRIARVAHYYNLQDRAAQILAAP